MKKVLIGAVISAALITGVSTPSFSAEKKSQQTFAVYYVDMQKIINESVKGKQAKTLIENRISQAKKKIEQMKKEIDQIKQKLQNPVISKQEKSKLENELQQKIRDLQRYQQDAQIEIMNLEKKYTMELIQEVVKLIQHYQKEKNIPMIVDAREAGIIAASPKYDLTETIIKLYNQQAGK